MITTLSLAVADAHPSLYGMLFLVAQQCIGEVVSLSSDFSNFASHGVRMCSTFPAISSC